MKMTHTVSTTLAAVALSLSLSAYADESDFAGFYIGTDGRTSLTSGTYSGLAEPNAGNLTLLFAHGNHYHGIGTYSYTGPAASPTVNDTNSNNRIPEISSLEAPLALNLGSGSLYSGKLTSQDNDSEYGKLTFAKVDTLDGYATGSEEQILFNSSSNRWSTLLGNTSVGLQLISSTPGLYVGDEQNSNLFANGDTISLDSYLNDEFAPIFWAAANVPAGTYTAEFRLVGLNDASINSGRFYFDFAPVAVPVPGAVWLFATGIFGLFGISRKQRPLAA